MTNYLQIAENYYQAINGKNLKEVQKYWHPEVKLISPLSGEAQAGSIAGAVARFMDSFTSIAIRSKFHEGNQVMLVIDVEYPQPIGKLRSAVQITFKDSLIASIELFHDTKPFQSRM